MGITPGRGENVRRLVSRIGKNYGEDHDRVYTDGMDRANCVRMR